MERARLLSTFSLKAVFEPFFPLLDPNDIAVGKVITLPISYLTFK